MAVFLAADPVLRVWLLRPQRQPARVQAERRRQGIYRGRLWPLEHLSGTRQGQGRGQGHDRRDDASRRGGVQEALARPSAGGVLQPRRRERPHPRAPHHEPPLRGPPADPEVSHRVLAEVHGQESGRPVQRDVPRAAQAGRRSGDPGAVQDGPGAARMKGRHAKERPPSRGYGGRVTVRLRSVLLLVVVAGACLLGLRPAPASELIFDTQEFAPFAYSANGGASGPVADIVRRVCGEMKIECPQHVLPWRRAQLEVQEGKALGMYPLGWNAERAKWLYFSPPLLITEYGFFVRNDNPL